MPTTLYLVGIVCWLCNCKYKSVSEGILGTKVCKVLSSLDVIRVPKTSLVPTVMDNFILGLVGFKCSRKPFLSCFLMIVCIGHGHTFSKAL